MPEDDRSSPGPAEEPAGDGSTPGVDRLPGVGRIALLREREPHFAWSKLSLLVPPQKSRFRGLTRTRVREILSSDYEAFDRFFEMAEALSGPEGLARIQIDVFYNEHLLYLSSLRMVCILAGLSPEDLGRLSGEEAILKDPYRRFHTFTPPQKFALDRLCDYVDIDWLNSSHVITRDVKWRTLATTEKPATGPPKAIRPA